MSGRIILLLFILVLSVQKGLAQTEEVPVDRSDSYKSIRGSIYKKSLTEIDKQGYKTDFKLRLSTSIYKYRGISDLFSEEIDHFNSIGLRPTLTFNFPTPWNNIRFIPGAAMQLTRRFDLEQTLLSGSLRATLGYENAEDYGIVGANATLEYGTRYDIDGLNLHDYLRLKLGTSLDKGLNWSIGKHKQRVTPFVSVSYFLRELDIGDSEEQFTRINTEYEAGLTFGSEPRMYLWKLRVPTLKVSFTYDGEVTGFKLRF
jgi:hypothetical protein